VHSLLADAQGVWAWAPHDRHAAAMRHRSMTDWMRANPDSDVRLWVSGELVRSLRCDAPASHANDANLRAHAWLELIERHGECAANWPVATWRNGTTVGACALDGIDIEALHRLALRHRVRVRSVVPWWYHAFQEARRCVNALTHLMRAQVCVVEGRQMAWIDTSAGLLVEVRQVTLDSAHVASLGEAMRSMATGGSHPTTPLVVLGQGLEDGARTHGLEALVLGRLDGQQPPQWLRPSFEHDMH
jgi:hypothetical protein